MNKLTDYGVPDGNILGIRYGFRGFYDKVSRTASPGQQLHAQADTGLQQPRRPSCLMP